MTARYQFFKTPHSLLNGDKEPSLHARVVESRVVTLDDLCRKITGDSSFTPGDVKGVMTMFAEELSRTLANGDTLEIEGVGSFGVSLHCPPVQNPKEIRAESIQFSRVVFKASQQLKDRLQSMSFVRASNFRPLDAYSKEERTRRIFAYLERESYITSSYCMGLNRCSRYRAQADLKELCEAGKVDRQGGRMAAVYVLPKNQQNA